MAVVKMSKLRLIGLLSDKNRLLDSMQKTGAVQITSAREIDGVLSGVSPPLEEVSNNRDSVALCLSILTATATELGDTAALNSLLEDGFTVEPSEFSQILNKSKKLLNSCSKVIGLTEKITSLKAEIVKYETEIEGYKPYLSVKQKFSKFNNGEQVKVKLGLINSNQKDKLFAEILALNTAECYEVASSGANQTVICVLSYKNGEVEEVLSSYQFTPCAFSDDFTANQAVEKLNEKILETKREIAVLQKEILLEVENARDLKILEDRYGYEIEKLTQTENFKVTDSTFILEAFVPVKKQEKVTSSIKKTTENYHLQYEEVASDDFAPTYLENGKFASNFEFVTNMYSAPKYGALDPNAVMGFFFSLFMGIITADAGYGLILALGGFLFAKKMAKDQGMKKLATVLALGGLFAIPFGVLFDSFLGFQILHPVFESSMGANNAYATFYAKNLDLIASFSSLAGISIPTMLLWSLLFGAIHLAAGYVVKAVHDFNNGRFLDGFIDGICWAVFLIGLSVFAFSMVDGVPKNVASIAQTVGLVMLLGGLAVAVIFAGRNNKGFGKVTGAFGSLYGVINLLSDILSYARLYGLMLSGSQVASIFTNTIAVDMLFPLGFVGVIFGVIVIIVGNLFNLAMGVLGAYIHDSRLQYVEFFGKFYEGDGQLFAPLGSKFEHIVYSYSEK